MHDPMTQAFEIRQFWRRKSQWGYRPAFITVWHVDPERDGSDDSCDWFWHKLTASEKAEAARLIDNDCDNLRTFFSTFIPQSCPTHGDNHDECDINSRTCTWGEFAENCKRDEMKHRIMTIFACYKRSFRWRWHPRWHFWHWKIQIHPLQHFKRWAFSRCDKCGKGFAWGYAPVSGAWHGTGPLWFRSEKHVSHGDCNNPKSDCLASAQSPDSKLTTG